MPLPKAGDAAEHREADHRHDQGDDREAPADHADDSENDTEDTDRAGDGAADRQLVSPLFARPTGV